MKLLRTVLCAALSAVCAMAQTKPGDMVVDVPFSFWAGRLMPPGHYIVQPINESNIRISSGSDGVYVSTHSAVRRESDGSKLVFHRYGDVYFLSAVWMTGNQSGRELFKSQAERERVRGKIEMQLAVVRPVK